MGQFLGEGSHPTSNDVDGVSIFVSIVVAFVFRMPLGGLPFEL